MNAHRPERKLRNGLAAFWALEPEVRAATDSGWTLTSIYELRQQRLAMSYVQLARRPSDAALKLLAVAKAHPDALIE